VRLALRLDGRKTLEVAQELYDGQGKKIITYPRAEVRYLPSNLMADCRGSWPACVPANRSGRSRCPSRR